MKQTAIYICAFLFILSGLSIVAGQGTVLAADKGVSYTPFVKWDPDGSGGTPMNWAGYETDLRDMNAAGINWVRVALSDVVSGRVTQTNPLTCSATLNTTHLDLLDTYGIQPLPLTWRGSKDYLSTDNNYLCILKEQVKALKARYPNRALYIEVHNEPNLSDFWKITYPAHQNSDPNQPNYDPVLYAQELTVYQGQVQQYVNYLKDTYTSIKQADSTVKVMNGGLSEYHSELWMDTFINLQGYNYIDIFAYHPYGNTPERVLSRLNSMKSKMAPISQFSGKPIWITEVGFHTNQNGNSGMFVGTGTAGENLKADYLLQTYQLLKNTSGVQLPIFWYDLVENGSTNAGFGLYIKNNTAPYTTTFLPAYTAYKELWVDTEVKFFNPTDDAYVNSAATSTNYGSSAEMRARGGTPTQLSYLKFNLSTLAGKTIKGTRLRLSTYSTVTASSSGTLNIKGVDDSSWAESTITYANRPLVGSGLNTFTAPSRWKWLNVTIPDNYMQPRIGSNVSFAVDTTDTDDASFFTRETATKPQLVVYVSTDVPVSVTPTSNPNDLNNDQQINGSDVKVILTNLLKALSGPINQHPDGKINILDAVKFFKNL